MAILSEQPINKTFHIVDYKNNIFTVEPLKHYTGDFTEQWTFNINSQYYIIASTDNDYKTLRKKNKTIDDIILLAVQRHNRRFY